MKIDHRIISKNYAIFIIFMVMMVLGVLTWMTNVRLNAFQQYHLALAHESLTGVEKRVAFYIAEKQRLVNLFAQDNLELIRSLANDPDNDAVHNKLGERISRVFPDRFAFSVADNHGTPQFEDFDGLVSDLCLSDIKFFTANKSKYRPYIHPNTEGYHFDIMVRYGKNQTEGIFFVSFLPHILGDIINSIQSSGHEIMLIYPQRQNLIEVIAKGARNKWVRNDYRLSAEEASHIIMRHDIDGTRWQAVDFLNPELYATYKKKLVRESAFILLIFTIVAMLFDNRLRREERQRELAEELKQTLMNVVSHEIRSPTSTIKTALEMIKSGDAGKIDTEAEEYIDMALNSTSRLLLVVDDLLEVDKIESGHQEFFKQDIKLGTLVQTAIDINQLYAKKFDSCYQLHGPIPDDTVNCDPHRIEQVLTNFLTNAAKYGTADVPVHVAVEKIGKRLRVSVTNQGPGIPDEFKDRVFEKFAMAYATSQKQKIKSSGLGLSIARAIIEQHGGTIGFHSEADKETTFWFELNVI